MDNFLFKTFSEKFKSDSHYYGDFLFVTNSQLGRLAKSPQTYVQYKESKMLRDIEPYVTALHFGRAYHMAMLEEDVYDDNVIRVDASTRTAKVWKEAVQEYNGHVSALILQSEHDTIMRMRDILYSIGDIKDILNNLREKEKVVLWRDKDTDVLCKSKIDAITNDNILVDLKTTTDCRYQSFKSSCYKYGYYRQSAFYLDGSKTDDFIFIVQEKSSPYDVALYEVSGQAIQQGRNEYKELLKSFKDYFVEEELNVEQSYKHYIL